MVANDNCSACEFQNGLASSRRYDENRLERNRKPLGRRVQHSNGWRGGSEPNLFKHVGLEAREIPAVGEVFSLDFPLYRTSSRPKGRGFLRSSAGFAKSLRRVPASLRGLTAATLHRRHIGAYPALVRSLDEEDFKMTDSEKQDGGPYIPGLKRRGFTAPLR